MILNQFFSYGRKQKVYLWKQGIIRLEGLNLDEQADSNMVGKSSLIEALVWGFFGETIRRVRDDKVVNRFAKKNCYVDISFNVDRVAYRLRRHRRHKKFGNNLLLWRGDHLIGYRHQNETQLKLETILGCNFRVFSNSVVFGGVKPFASLTDAEQKKVFESFLHFEEFDEALMFTRSQMTKIRTEIDQFQLTITEVKGNVQAAKETIKAIKSSQRSVRDQLRSELDELGRQRDANHDTSRSSLRHCRREMERASERVRAAEKRVSIAEVKVSQTKKQIKALTGQIDKWQELIGKPCPTCGQKITEQSRKEFLEHVRSDRKSLLCKLYNRRDIRSKQRKVVMRHAEAYQSLLNRYNKTNQIHKNTEAIEERMSKINAAIRSSRHMHLELDRALTKHIRAVSKLLSLQFKVASLKKKYEDLSFWEQGFGNKGIKSLIIKQALPTLNSKLAEYAGKIFGPKATVEFVPTKQTKKGEARDLFHIRYVATRGGDSYKSESGGGRRRVDICILLVLSWLSRTCNLLLVDELLDGLDQTGRETVLEALSNLRGTVLVISHRKELKAQIGKVWVVRKHHGVSKLITDVQATI